MRKRILALILGLTLIMSTVIPVWAEPTPTEDKFFIITADGTIYARPELTLKYIVIPSTIGGVSVKSIGENGFYNKRLRSVIIPSGVTTIGNGAFQNPYYDQAQELTVTIPEGVISIGDNAFLNSGLTTISIPSSVTSIGSGAFSGNHLTSVVIPSNVITIKYNAFSNNDLTTISIPSSVTSIGSGAFSGNHLTSVVIPSNVITIEDSTFYDNDLTSLEIPNTVTSIGKYAFAYNELTSVVIPEGVTSIGQSAFENNNLAYHFITNVDIAASVTRIGLSAFRGNKLTSITMRRADTDIDYYNGMLNTNGASNFPYAYSIGGIGTYKGTQEGPWTKELTDSEATTAAKAAIVDGTVEVPYGSTQDDKTAAVQEYVDDLLTGDAAGVTATVTYNSGTGKYDVAISKGSSSESKSLSMTVNVAPDPDIAKVAAAKTALVDGTVNVAFGGDQTAKTAAVQTYVNSLLTGYATGVTGTVTYNSETGNYDVAISKGSVSESKNLSMTVNVAPDPDIAKVAAAKTALVDGTVNVAFGGDQTAKTAAVQTYVNSLLTGYATGVTGTVTYNSETGNYDVAISKGSVSDSKSLTMTVNVAASPDIAAVAAAKTALVDGTVNVAFGGDQTAKTAAVQTYVNSLLTGDAAGVTGTVTYNSGTGNYDVSISKGNVSDSKSLTMTVNVAPNPEMPRYEVSGTVIDDNAINVNNATVKLMSGQTQIGITATTNGTGAFTIPGVPNGTYNLVVSKEDIIVTSIIKVNNSNYAAGTITLPAGKTNSVVEVKGIETPKIVVGGLDAQFTKTQSSEDNKGITAVDMDLVQDGGKVEIKLTAEKKAEGSAPNANNIRITAQSGNKTVGTFIDLSVVKTVTTSVGAISVTPLIELNDLIEVLIPLDQAMLNKTDYIVYRYHGGSVESITTTANDGEKFELIDNNKTIKLTVKKFSTYAIAYTSAPEPTPEGSISGTTLPTINVEQTKGGKVVISTDKKTAAITPDDGYVIGAVIIDGKSVDAIEEYTFTDSKNHTIKAVFVKESALPYYLQNNEKTYIGFSVIAGKSYQYIAPKGVTVEYRENPKNFKDNTIEWAKPSINFVTERELFVGTSQDTFSPNTSMTRAMFVTVVGRLYERSYGNVTGTSTFTDVDANAYYAKYVVWANENGVIKGVGNNKFAPDENVTREQMAVIMLNFAKLLNKADVTKNPLSYTDSASISSWAIDGAIYCQETNIIKGRDGGNIAPQESATRAEVAAVVERLIETIMK